MHIVFVKKILEDGSLCKKCREVNQRLAQDGISKLIDKISIADLRDANSEGIILAKKHQIERAPFFIVDDNEGFHVFDVYFKFRKYLLSKELIDQTTPVKL